MIKLVLQRLASAFFTLVLVAGIVFVLLEALPGDACTAKLERNAKGGMLENCRKEYQLDRPATVRFAEWAVNFAHGDFGVSIKTEKPIVEVVGNRLRNTVALATTATLIGIPLAIFLGIMAGLYRDRFADISVSSISIVAMTIPEFVTATVLILVFSVMLGWTSGVVTAGPNASLSSILSSTVLPTATLTFVMTAHILRMVRSSIIDTMSSDFVTMARLKGVPFWRLVWRHVVPNSLLPTINVIGLTIAWLLGGVVVIEKVFNYPGIGRLAVDAVSDQDLPLVQCISLILAAIYIATNTLTDLAALALNPRLRTYRT